MPTHRVIRPLTVFLAILAVGWSQVFGVAAGYLCGCTGETSARGYCEPAECHPESTAQHAVPIDGDPCGDCPSDPVQTPDDRHSHQEIRQIPLLTGFPPPPAAPPAVWFALPPFCQAVSLFDSGEPLPVAAGPDPPGSRGPAMPQLVARTTVMLI